LIGMTTDEEIGSKGYHSDEELESLEVVLLKAFETEIQEEALANMSWSDMVICREIYLCQQNAVPRHYDEIAFRLLNRQDYFESDSDVAKTMLQARERGHINYILSMWGSDECGHRPVVDVHLNSEIESAFAREESKYNEKEREIYNRRREKLEEEKIQHLISRYHQGPNASNDQRFGK
jgi:hypothetical protein